MNEETKISKNRFHGLWALTNRDLKKWYQNPIVFVIGIIQPILWLALLGKAMNISSILSAKLDSSITSKSGSNFNNQPVAEIEFLLR